jgi:hypothetical protein
MNEYNFGDADNYRNGAKNNVVRLKDLFPRPTQDSDQENHDYPDLHFTYADSDTLANEIAELYSYTEQPEFQNNVKAFEDYMEMLKLVPCWKRLNVTEKGDIIVTLLDQMDVADKNIRLKCTRCFLYLAQGCWAECQSDVEQRIFCIILLMHFRHVCKFHIFFLSSCVRWCR